MFDALPGEYQQITELLSERVPSESLIVINAGDSDDGGGEIVSSPTVPSRPPHQFNITLVLARNLYPRLSSFPDGQPYEEYRSDHAAVTWIEEWQRAVGAFMTMLEAHGFSEEESRNHLSGVSGIEQIWDTIESQTEDERFVDLKSYLEAYSGDDVRFDHAREHGSKRRISDLSEEEMEMAEELLEHSAKDPGACYESTITALRHDLDNEQLSYVEGVSLPKYGGMLQAHAWFEINGKVVEPTWPWHRPIPPEPSVYYGESVDPEAASDAMSTHGRYGSIASMLLD